VRCCLVADGGGRCGWEVEGDSASEESLRGRFLVRDDDERTDDGVWITSGTVLGSIVGDAKDEASDVVEKGFVFVRSDNVLQQTRAITAGKATAEVDAVLECNSLEKAEHEFDGDVNE
jgi:hypothetical protein